MSYTAEISRANPACILFLLDQSGSMKEPFSLPGEPPIPKAKGVADAINRLIGELIVNCTEEDTVLDRFHLGVITYGGQARLAPAFPMLRALSEVAANPLRVETRTLDAYDGAGGIIRKEAKLPIWFEPLAEGNTPMCSALALGKSLVEPWSASHPQSFPPIIFNITDGASTDGDPLPGLRGLQGCGTQDGPALSINMLLADGRGGANVFPSSAEHLPEGPLRSLVEGASVLPEAMRRRAAKQHEMTIPEGARGVVLNAHLVDVIRLLDIGTRPVNA
jgi:uncharacterized protein YegL